VEPVLGIDIGGTKLAGGIVDEQGGVVRMTVVPTDPETETSVMDGVAALARQLLAQSPNGVRGIGFGIPGTIDRASGTVVQAANLPLFNVPFVERMQNELGLPVAIDNDANVAALAEHRFGAARGARHSLMLTLGTGVGGGVVIDDRLFRGATGSAGELGHMVIDKDGPPCPGSCNNHGCLEVYCSGTGLLIAAREAGLPDHDARSVVNRALAGEPDAKPLLDELARCLGIGLSSYTNIFNPEVIVIGGGLASSACSYILPIAEREVRSRSLEPNASLVRIVPARFGPEAGMVGAGELARSELWPAA
jgi:glucokinase